MGYKMHLVGTSPDMLSGPSRLTGSWDDKRLAACGLLGPAAAQGLCIQYLFQDQKFS